MKTLSCIIALLLVFQILHADKPSEPFQKKQKELTQKLQVIEKDLKAMPLLLAPEQLHIMLMVNHFFQTEIVPLAADEEKSLYQLIDSKVPHMADTMSYEHIIMNRWASEINLLSSSSTPDMNQFISSAYSLVGLLKAHLEMEKEILFPILDIQLQK